MTDAQIPRPRISPSPEALPFWTAAEHHELLLPYCTACDRYFFYPRTLCPTCGSREVSWRASTGRGSLHTFCIQYRSTLPGFGDSLPFVTAIVELEEGPRLMTFLVDVPAESEAIRCGMPVEVAFIDGNGGATLPVFRPRRQT